MVTNIKKTLSLIKNTESPLKRQLLVDRDYLHKKAVSPENDIWSELISLKKKASQ